MTEALSGHGKNQLGATQPGVMLSCILLFLETTLSILQMYGSNGLVDVDLHAYHSEK